MTLPLLRPIPRSRLADDLADRIKGMIEKEHLVAGKRLPAITMLAQKFGVGAPTVREALKRLEAAGAVEIRHGSGVYVADEHDALVIGNPVYSRAISRELLLDLLDARLAIEVPGAALAAERATAGQLEQMAALLQQATEHFADDEMLNRTNMAFHRAIAEASGNVVFRQMLDVLTRLFTREQRAILDIQNARERDHAEHVTIHAALLARDPMRAEALMSAHLKAVRADLARWNPTTHPIGTSRALT